MCSRKRGVILNNNKTRKNPRLKEFDYATCGYYFITICTKEKKHFLGEIRSSKMNLNRVGKLAESALQCIPEVYENIEIDKYVVMPNHIHMIIIIRNKTNVTISRIIKQYKETITKKAEVKIWQRSYYDHIIRDEKDYFRIWQYIDENILKWSLDKYYNDV